jgi:hypothetical protein
MGRNEYEGSRGGSIPASFDDMIGKLVVNRGTYLGRRMLSLDACDICHPEKCSINHLCTYQKKDCPCPFERKLIQGFDAVVFRNFGSTMSEPELFFIGVLLNPMISMLAKLYKQMLAVKPDELYSRQKMAGGYKTHPLLADLRVTISEIAKLWKSLGLQGSPIIPKNPLSSDGQDDGGLVNPNFTEKGQPEMKRRGK